MSVGCLRTKWSPCSYSQVSKGGGELKKLKAERWERARSYRLLEVMKIIKNSNTNNITIIIIIAAINNRAFSKTPSFANLRSTMLPLSYCFSTVLQFVILLEWKPPIPFWSMAIKRTLELVVPMTQHGG